ncbi:TPA: biotin synthase BioB [Burkholderia aenigmatica]|uniref:biotin synthase BioB n=1 Tax=Burkholderia sp. AU45251 TaxID=3059204 RepID=UPI00265334CA|nr:biotin synthase BioB [Burkholderia sp. AU45251]HDR9484154.1 biotin synthase BioB [Burkholderia aenigmatica]MDN7516412.1 biotin synthase BioB [Burkholderia sp. AU45251]HDR9515119.1 biotin synthase BioB [Burkholderia aenigmatica]HDR9592204.1 biotin synthase BioB [Burkholderia aenigmatica]HDR9603578.1 biotin synthase BioB [Burkholderia aenigmatica]
MNDPFQVSRVDFHRNPARAASPETTRWQVEHVRALFELPFNDLLFRAHQVHREHHAPNAVQRAALLSVKTGGCAENCGYCSQSAHHDAGIEAGKLMALDDVLEAARSAQAQGATRFCMGAAWRAPKDRDIDAIGEMIQAVKGLGLETCVTLGMLQPEQARRLKGFGLDYYNHNLDTSPQFYANVVTTRTYEDRLNTIAQVRAAGINVCCGGILGLGESRADRVALIAQLAALDPHPESVPVNNLIPIPGTPLGDAQPVDPFEIVRTVAAARITMPGAVVRLTAGRENMSDAVQALCFFAGANSIFQGERLLTTDNPTLARDRALMSTLGLEESN